MSKQTVKNVLILSDIYQGGEWIATHRLIKEIHKGYPLINFFLVAYTKNKTLIDQTPFKKVAYVQYANAPSPLSFLKNLLSNITSARNAIYKLVHSVRQVDCILSTHYLMTIAAYTIGKTRKKTLIFSFHGIKSSLYFRDKDFNYREVVIKTLERMALLLSSRIIVPSKAGKQMIQNMLPFFADKKITSIIPNIVPAEFFHRVSKKELNDYRKLLQIPVENNILLYSGRLIKYKGLESILDALVLLRKKQSALTLIIAYPNNHEEISFLNIIKEKVRELEMTLNVRFISNPNISTLRKIYQLSDVLILPSEYEVSPLVIDEALASGTPVIGSLTGDIPEKLIQLDPQLILNSFDSDEICKALKYFLGLQPKRVVYLKTVAQKISSEQSSKEITEKFKGLLDSLSGQSS